MTLAGCRHLWFGDIAAHAVHSFNCHGPAAPQLLCLQVNVHDPGVGVRPKRAHLPQGRDEVLCTIGGSQSLALYKQLLRALLL
jgi:hypothetical protein